MTTDVSVDGDAPSTCVPVCTVTRIRIRVLSKPFCVEVRLATISALHYDQNRAPPCAYIELHSVPT